MTVTIDRRTDINLDTAYRVAWQGEDVVLSAKALARIDECRNSFLSLVESDPIDVRLRCDDRIQFSGQNTVG